ncbi:obscurin-like [Sparus aurata]|uniref:obscurin-like n=1 Tax=Sparus aurata TaxID=8175 RepID=UPI0011C10A13|nr:obscurin-like [Sparus aurata]
MRLNCCLTILHVSILAALLVHLEAYSEDCEVEIRVRRNTVYKASVGEELRINCTVVFCNNSPPTVSWFKPGETYVNVGSSSLIKTEWKKLDDSRGISYLVFKKIHMSDSGEYQCRSGGSMSHNINVSVSGEVCEDEIRVRRNTVYKASVGEELRINCTVVFCNNSPPTVSWFKRGETDVPVNVSSGSLIETEWKKLNDSQGISYLVFKKILKSDSGEYQCRGGGSASHNINVFVSDPGPAFPHYALRIVGIVVLVIVVMIIYVASRAGCKVRGVHSARTSREAPDLSPHHIYENDP